MSPPGWIPQSSEWGMNHSATISYLFPKMYNTKIKRLKTNSAFLNKRNLNKVCLFYCYLEIVSLLRCVLFVNLFSNDIIYIYKSITMMRGKSPRSNVEITKKKLNFVAAILDFWRAFLNQFWPNLVHTSKINLWISFVLCVVYKCQYFWSYSRKTHF